MSSAVIEGLPAAVRAAGRALLCDASALILLAAPLAAFVVFALLCRFRTAPRGAYLALSSACAALFAALFPAAGEPAVPALCVALAAWAVYALLFCVLLFIRRRKRRPERRKGPSRAGEEEEEVRTEGQEGTPRLSAPVPELPRKVRCFAQGGRVVVGEDVRLGHAFSVLERLLSLPLGAGDRLEAQKAEDLLSVYRGKGELSAEEARALNDVLASLLKMLAKYEG